MPAQTKSTKILTGHVLINFASQKRGLPSSKFSPKQVKQIINVYWLYPSLASNQLTKKNFTGYLSYLPQHAVAFAMLTDLLPFKYSARNCRIILLHSND
eukprot:TRINITY_DN3791_c0_g2_i1.p1 TRINITY_DN3791_c0_g2~~TRINITY_DN3791_c0_g2_i1.p1  ORF type:complete len:110 (+),score=6.08 TRINITY_DN3791_c0_g2_i1:35-331(+)